MIIRTKYRTVSRITSRLLVRSIAAWIAMQAAQGADGTWVGGTAGTGAWSNAANWLGGIVPGSTASKTNTDTVNFKTAPVTLGTSASPVLIDSSRNFKSISFTGAAGNYVVGTTTGSTLTLTAGGTIQLGALTSTNVIETINAPLNLQGVSTLANNSANGSGLGAGTLNFGGGITFSPSSTLALSGSNTNANTISGVVANGPATAVTFVKSGSGTWALTGLNTFNATVQINEGTLAINSLANGGAASSLGAGNGAITLGTSSTAARLQFNGLSGGSTNRALSVGFAGGTIENAVAGQTLNFSGAVSPTTTVPGMATLLLTGAGDGVMSGSISNAIAPTKGGAGTWTFSGPNSYTGTTTIGGGTLKLGNARALGFGGTQTNSTANTIVGNGATLDLNGNAGINEPITVSGTGADGKGALVNNSSSSATIGSGIAGIALPTTGFGAGLRTAPTVAISGTGSGATAVASLGITTASISSVAGGTGWVTGDTVSITGGGGRSAVGVVTASGGAIRSITITNPGYGFITAPTSMQKLVSANGTGGTMVGNANFFTVGGLTVINAGTGYTGTPTITIGGTTAPVTTTLSSVNLASDSSVGGTGDLAIQSSISGAGLTKVGTGTLTLSGASTFTGDTTIRAGTLKLDLAGSLSHSPTITVGDAGSTGAHLDVTTKTGGLTIGTAQTLKGIGQIDGDTTIQGTHAPGNSPGLETFNGNLAYSTGSMLNWELATNSEGTRGTDFDGINVLGAGNLSIAAGVTANLVFNALGSTVDWSNVFWLANHSWMVFDGASSPSLASIRIFDTINVSTDSLGITLVNGIFTWDTLGDDVYLNFTAIPEPAGIGTLTAFGLLGLGTLRRKRNARR